MNELPTTSSIVGCRMTDEERQILAEKLDGDLEQFINTRERKPFTDGFTMDNMEEEIQSHPAFRTKPIDVDDGGELPPLIEAMRQLKYDPNENSADELARNYKDDGNYNFKLCKYRWAIDAYTAGIKLGCESAELNAQLLTNRAAANYRLGNYRSSHVDCERALEAKNDHLKAVVKGAQSCFQMQRYGEAISWCTKGLKLKADEATLLDLRTQSLKQKKIFERDIRKKQAIENKDKLKRNELLDVIKARGIRILASSFGDDVLSIESLEPHSSSLGAKVRLDADGHLVWPFIFVYPEFAQTDFIREFTENETLIAHLEVIFGADSDRPPWDPDYKYRPEFLKIYFEDELCSLWEVNSNDKLEDILKHPGYIVSGGAPSVIVLVERSEFQREFLKNYKIIKKV